MAFVISDRIKETSTTTGTGTLTLAGAVTGFTTFAAVGDGNTCTYAIIAVDANGVPTGEWETGIGTYTSAGTTLSRGVIKSSNSNNLVTFSAGTKHVICTDVAGYATPFVMTNTTLNCIQVANQTLLSSTAGNTRGIGAVDLQIQRFNAAQVASGAYSVVAGGSRNKATASWAVSSGGVLNSATGQYSFVGSGSSNIASGSKAAVVGGYVNHAYTTHSFVGGGTYNSAITNVCTAVCGGKSNTASGAYAFVGGGLTNKATGLKAVIVGGGTNKAYSTFSFVGGGLTNTAQTNAYATIVGGKLNTTTGKYSFIGGGWNNSITSYRTTIGGGVYNTCSGPAATISGGASNTASGPFGSTVCGGYTNTSSGRCSIVFSGRYNTASGDYSSAAGRKALADKYGQATHATGQIAAQGDAQTSEFVLRKQTTNGTQTELFTDGSSARLTLSNDTSWAFRMLVVARRTDANDETGAWEFLGAIDRNASAATTAIVGAVTKTIIALDTSAWDVAVDADTTNGSLRIQVTGQAAKTINWVCTVWATETTG